MANSQKLCDSCQQWSHWKRGDHDLCEHCGSRLIPIELVEAETRRIEKINKTQIGLFQIEPDDKDWIKFLKRSMNFTHFVFAACVSFVVWLISMVAP